MSEIIKLTRRVGRISVGNADRTRSPFPDLRDIVLEDIPRTVVPPIPLMSRDRAAAPVESSLETAEPVLDEEELRGLLEEHFQRGVAEGRLDAEKQAEQMVEAALVRERSGRRSEAVERLDSLAAGLQKQFGQMQRKAEEAVVRLALSIAEQVVKREVRLDNAIVIEQIREALHRVVGVERMKIRVNPADETVIREHRSAIIAGSDAIRELVIEPDPKIEAGGCIIESDSGNVDARLSTQLKKIESLFLDQNVVS